MAYLQKHGFSHEQAYTLMAVAPIETRVLACANIPTANVSLGLPLKAFALDLLPSTFAIKHSERGSVAYLSRHRKELYLATSRDEKSPFDAV